MCSCCWLSTFMECGAACYVSKQECCLPPVWSQRCCIIGLTRMGYTKHSCFSISWLPRAVTLALSTKVSSSMMGISCWKHYSKAGLSGPIQALRHNIPLFSFDWLLGSTLFHVQADLPNCCQSYPNEAYVYPLFFSLQNISKCSLMGLMPYCCGHPTPAPTSYLSVPLKYEDSLSV